MRVSIILCIFFFVGCYAVCTNPISTAAVPSGYCPTIWASGLSSPRGIITASNGDVIVTESGLGRLSLFYKSGTSWVKVNLASASGLNHAVLINGGYIYASSASTVYRWAYTAGTRTNLGTATTVITGIPTGGHSTRSLNFDSSGNLLVQVGSASNVDSDASRAGIRKFNLATGIPQTFTSGAWFVQGLRNEVGLEKDSAGNLWGVENGMDNLNRADLGGDIHLGNPGEEVNLFTAGKFYGYPYCWSQYNLSTVATPRGTQYGLAPFLTDGIHTDAWCQNTNNVVKPSYLMRPHTAPLDLLFYYGTTFPGYNGDLFVAQHGSWNSAPAVGYRVIRIDFQSGVPVSETPFLYYVGPGETGTGWHRPVGLTLINDGGKDVLLVTSDSTGVIIAVAYLP